MTRMDVVVTVVCASLVVSIATLTFGQGDAPAQRDKHVKSIKDATQVSQIHKALIIFANDNSGRFMVPGLVNRLAVRDDAGPALAGKQIPGMGPEDTSLNTTAHMYSALIAQQFFAPELTISPIERNPHVKVDRDYEYDAYNPAEDSYWDTTFTADLKAGSNTSYAHQPITTERKHLWNNQMIHDLAQLGNRGPRHGALDPDSYTCGPHGNWAGSIIFGDNHSEFFTTTEPATLKGDNLFAADAGQEIDALIAFTKTITIAAVELQFD